MIPRLALLLLPLLWLAACGGGTDGHGPAAPLGGQARAQAAARVLAADAGARRGAPAATTAAVDPEDAANQLFDFAQITYPAFFPGRPATASALGYLYRHYPDTGLYLGVQAGRVYVMGGSFGNEPLEVGALTDFITPEPRILSNLCAGGQAVDRFTTPRPQVGRNAALAIVGCTGAIGAPQWRQTEGPAVPLPADKTQTISFDPPEPGRYGFELRFTDPQGLGRTETLTLDAAPASAGPAQLSVRASLSVRMGGKVSVRAWPTLPEGDEVKAVTWTQVEGPAVTLNLDTSRLALFTAPTVSRDTLVRLRATLHTTQGRRVSDEVAVLVEYHRQAPASQPAYLWAGEHVPRLYAYRAEGPYRDALVPCVYDSAMVQSGGGYNLCRLSRLPFLGQDTGGAVPSVEQVMDRVIVSHDWLGRNFEAFLRQHDGRGDFRRMLNSVTAVVLSTSVRPSFYYAGTGAIYLDADNFWITPEERDTVNEAPDFRSEFGNGLQFDYLWRYVQDNRSIFAYFNPRERITRTLDDVRNESAWLMYHELGHALDFLPPSAFSGLNRNRSAWDNIAPRYSNFLLTSDQVSAEHPLTSSVMQRLGQVLFQGETASAQDKALVPDQVAAAFGADLATDPYSYSSTREDIAMTLEEMLMQHRLGIRRDVAITDLYDSDNASSSTAIVRWGQRGRIGTPALQARARAIVLALTPWVDANEVDRLPAPLAMRPGESWGANLSQPAAPRRALAAADPAWLRDWQLQRTWRRQALHAGGGKKLPPVQAPPRNP